MPQCPDIKITCLNNVRYMLIKPQATIQRHPKLFSCMEKTVSDLATHTPVPQANLSALTFPATSSTSDFSGLRSIPFSVNQSLTATVHSSSFLISESDFTATY